MSYQDTLSQMVNNCGLTLREIADKCRDKGVPLDPSYISKLQTGKQGPASEEISQAIAEACGADPDALILEGYLDKAPKPIRDFVDNILAYFRRFAEYALSDIIAGENAALVLEQFRDVPAIDFMRMVSTHMFDMTKPKDDSLLPLYDAEHPTLKIVPKVLVPVNDDSMSPLIPPNATVQITIFDKYHNSEIVAASLPDNTFLIRRIVFQDEQIILVPDNKKYQVLFLPREQLKIIGKVTSLTLDLD